VSTRASSRIAHRFAAADEEGERTGETKMKTREKEAPEQGIVAQAVPFRVPASIEEAYERGWQWKRESFANLMAFGHTIEGVTRREGLAHFEGPNGKELVIPFVATYAFGEPRVPKYPYEGGSVCLIDDDEEHAATLERKAIRSTGKGFEVKLWKVQYRFRGRVVHTYITPTPMAEDDAYYAFCDELDLYVSEVKTKAPSAHRRTKKAKARR
jgi:hypothetical protein